MARRSSHLLALVAMLVSAPAAAQIDQPKPDLAKSDFPNRPITMIVPFPGGGGADAVPRLTQDAMAAALGQPIIIENRPGAGGTLGAVAVMRAAPDGYTVMNTPMPPVTINVFLQKNFPYDPKTAFEPVVLATVAPLVIAVNASLPVHNMAELVAYARANPGKLSYGSAGIGTGHHIAGELLKSKTGIDMAHVPYRGSGLLIQDLISGSIQVGFGTPPAVMTFVEEGKLRALGVAEATRYRDLPELPTLNETIPGVIAPSWNGLFVPAGTPRPIIERLNKAMNAALKVPSVAANFKLQGMLPVGGPPEDLVKLIDDDLAHWGKVLPAIGLLPQ